MAIKERKIIGNWQSRLNARTELAGFPPSCGQRLTSSSQENLRCSLGGTVGRNEGMAFGRPEFDAGYRRQYSACISGRRKTWKIAKASLKGEGGLQGQTVDCRKSVKEVRGLKEESKGTEDWEDEQRVDWRKSVKRGRGLQNMDKEWRSDVHIKRNGDNFISTVQLNYVPRSLK